MTKTNTKHQNKHHHPVLLESVIELLNPSPGESYLDLTAGYGGHAAKIIEAIGESGNARLVDRDDLAITELTKQFGDQQNIEILQTDYETAVADIAAEATQYDMVLADLGVSSPHLDMPERGFSFKSQGPLDMRMDQRQATTAADIARSSSEQVLFEIIRRYGEEPQARKIAVAMKAAERLETTSDLVSVVQDAIGEFRAKAAIPRVFQALRIATNDELGQLERMLAMLPGILASGGRLAIISFHSLEDRLVKQSFKDASIGLEPTFELLTKKPIKGKLNDPHPRARSAMLRAAVKQ